MGSAVLVSTLERDAGPTTDRLEQISRLRLGSRPPKRKQPDAIEDFRAIPWVFSWTQARVVLPAWFGLGTALAAAREEVGLELLCETESRASPGASRSGRSPGSLRTVWKDCQVMRRITSVMVTPMIGSPMSRPSATTIALATTARLTNPSVRAWLPSAIIAGLFSLGCVPRAGGSGRRSRCR